MSIHIGAVDSQVYVGSQLAQEVYVGGTKVWPIITQPTFKGATGGSGTSVALPSHQPGDLILIFALRAAFATSGTTPPSQPSESGTVPAFTTLFANTGTSGAGVYTSLRVAYTKATSSTHTSGQWANATNVAAVVFSGGSVGAAAETGGIFTASNQTTAPGVSLIDSSGSSQIVHCFIATPYLPAPTGYTTRLAGSNTTGQMGIITKDVTNVDGPVTMTASSALSGYSYRSATVEILGQ